MKPRLLLAAVAALSFATLASGEIEKLGNLCDSGVCVYWWPKLPAVKGWHQEEEVSRKQGVNALAPDGSTFKDAETVMYGTAATKVNSDATTLDEFIAADMKGFAEHAAEAVIKEIEPLTTADGRKLRTFTFFPKKDGNWECVSFGEEGEYFLVFTLSSRNKMAYEKSLPVFQAMIREYKE
jgi:hypothetical protein